jgi:hypothetical protein
MREVGGRPPGRLREWRFLEVQTADGTWQLSEPVVGSKLPAVWLRVGQYPEPEPELDQARQEITGCVLVRGGADAAGSVLAAQHLLMFLAQTHSVQAAAIIARAAGPGSGTWFTGFGVAASRLCAVLIARSVIQEVPSVETQQSIQRFRPVLADALTAAGAGLLPRAAACAAHSLASRSIGAP